MEDEEHEFVDMKRSAGDRQPNSLMDAAPEYSPGLTVHLTKAELEKVGLPHDCAVGDMIFLDCLCHVKMVSQDCVCLQITHLKAEGEEEEGTPEDVKEDNEEEREVSTYNRMRREY